MIYVTHETIKLSYYTLPFVSTSYVAVATVLLASGLQNMALCGFAVAAPTKQAAEQKILNKCVVVKTFYGLLSQLSTLQ